MTLTTTNRHQAIRGDQRTRRTYVFASVDPGTYVIPTQRCRGTSRSIAAASASAPSSSSRSISDGSGRDHRERDGTAAAPLIETSNASTGTVLDADALQTLPAAGRAAFLVGTTVPTVVPSGDAQFNRQQDQTNASLLRSAAVTRRGNNYTLDGVPITDLTNRAVANPTIESLDDVKVQVHTYDAEMGRTGGGVFNTTLRSARRVPRHGLLPFASRVGRREQLLQSESARAVRARRCVVHQPQSQAGHIVVHAGRRVRRTHRQEPHVLLVRDRGLPQHSTRNSPGIVLPTLASAAVISRRRRPATGGDPDFRTGDAPAVPEHVIPANRLNPVAVKMLSSLPLPQRTVDDGAANFSSQAVINDEFQQLQA